MTPHPKDDWAGEEAQRLASHFDPDPTNFQLNEIALALRQARNRGLEEGWNAARDKARGIVKQHRNCFTPVCPIEKEIAAMTPDGDGPNEKA